MAWLFTSIAVLSLFMVKSQVSEKCHVQESIVKQVYGPTLNDVLSTRNSKSSIPKVNTNKCDIEGYYWRQLSKKLPKDVFFYFGPHYIGRILFSKALLPASFYKHDSRQIGRFTYKGKRYSDNRPTLVLCTIHPERFKWILTNSSGISSLETDKQWLVEVGFKGQSSIYFGWSPNNSAHGMITTFKKKYRIESFTGKHLTFYDIFYVLAFVIP